MLLHALVCSLKETFKLFLLVILLWQNNKLVLWFINFRLISALIMRISLLRIFFSNRFFIIFAIYVNIIYLFFMLYRFSTLVSQVVKLRILEQLLFFSHFLFHFMPLSLSLLLWHHQGWELCSFILCLWLGFHRWKFMYNFYVVKIQWFT